MGKAIVAGPPSLKVELVFRSSKRKTKTTVIEFASALFLLQIIIYYALFYLDTLRYYFLLGFLRQLVVVYVHCIIDHKKIKMCRLALLYA